MPNDYAVKVLEAPESGAPDAGLAAIAAEFTAGAAAGMVRRRRDPSGFGPDPVRPDDVWLLDIQPGVLTAAGILDLGQEWGPPTGYIWRLTEVTIILGAGTSLVQIFKASALNAVGLMLQTTASGVWEPARRYLQHGQRMVAVATGGGVTIVPDGERISTGFFPTYAA